MNKLERWLPFKFHRKDRSRKVQDLRSTPNAPAPMETSPVWPQGPSSMFSAPMHQLVQGVFNDPFFRDPFGRFGEMDRWFGDFCPNRFAPSVEVSDEEDSIQVSVELPGLSKDDVRLQIENDMLVLSGEKKRRDESRNNGIFRTERYFGYFQRAIPLPDDVDGERCKAEFKEGVLTVRLPKVDNPSPRGTSIEIS